MTEDIVKRLRWVADLGIPDFTNAQLLREAADEIERLRTELAVVVADRAATFSHKEALERDRDALDDTLCDIAYLLGCRANTTEPIEAVKSVIAKAAEIERLRAALIRIGHPNKNVAYCRDGHEESVLLARATLEGRDG